MAPTRFVLSKGPIILPPPRTCNARSYVVVKRVVRARVGSEVKPATCDVTSTKHDGIHKTVTLPNTRIFTHRHPGRDGDSGWKTGILFFHTLQRHLSDGFEIGAVRSSDSSFVVQIELCL